MFQMGMLRRILAMAFVLGAGSSVYAAEGGAWSVSKSSGEVWVTSTEAQPASLTPSEIMKRATGKELGTADYIDDLRRKVAELSA